MDIYIYGLYNTFSNEIRYVGKTNNIPRRLSEHIIEAKKGKFAHLPKNKWILKTLQMGGNIEAKLLEKTNDKEWEEREMFWISYYKKLPNNLNIARGGETCIDHFFVNYDECKKWVLENIDTKAINSSSKWKKIASEGKLPEFIPHNPWSIYRYENFSWFDFLSKDGKKTYNLRNEYMTFDELSQYINENKINSCNELYRKIKENPQINIPRDIARYYKRRGYNVDELFNKFYTYDEFVQYIKENFPEISSAGEYYKKHKYMDKKAPFYFKEIYYKKGDVENIFSEKFLSYDDCSKMAKDANLTTPLFYTNFVKENKGCKMPYHPQKIYKDTGWKDWETFLQCRNKKMRKNCSFELFCRYMKIYHPYVKNSGDYKKMMKTENVSRRVPFRPDSKYKCKWGEIFKKIESM